MWPLKRHVFPSLRREENHFWKTAVTRGALSASPVVSQDFRCLISNIQSTVVQPGSDGFPPFKSLNEGQWSVTWATVKWSIIEMLSPGFQRHEVKNIHHFDKSPEPPSPWWSEYLGEWKHQRFSVHSLQGTLKNSILGGNNLIGYAIS